MAILALCYSPLYSGLHAQQIISEVKRDGTIDSSFADGIGADIKTPLVLLVDERTASASEIMAAALQVLMPSSMTSKSHPLPNSVNTLQSYPPPVYACTKDNKRAVLVSSSKTAHTFGKGRIQNVQELADGSAVVMNSVPFPRPNLPSYPSLIWFSE